MPKSNGKRFCRGEKMIFRDKANPLRVVLSLLILGMSLLTISGAGYSFDDLALTDKLEFVNVDIRDIFRNLAEIGKFKVLFAHEFQDKATMIIDTGSLLKQTVSDIAVNHGLIVKWLNSNTVVIGNNNSLSQINTSDINLHVIPLKHLPSISVAKALETVVSSYKIRYDFKTNEIAVMANSLELQNIKELINQWDRDLPLLNTDIKVVEVTAAFLESVGLTNSASPEMKVFPLTKKQMEIIEQNTGKNLLAKQKVISFNNQEEQLFFGDQIPDVSEESKAETLNYQIGYVGVGTNIDYSIRIDHEAEYELLVELQAKVNTIDNTDKIQEQAKIDTSDTSERKIKTTVGLNPGDTIMLTGALNRDEYLRMKTPLYEFSFLASLFNSQQPNDTPESQDAIATMIFLTPSFTEKIAYPSKPDLESTQQVPIVQSIANEPVKTAETTNINYTIKRRDTLTSISKKFGVSLQSIIKANQLKNPGIIKTNSNLMIPVPNERIYVVKTNETVWRLAKRYGTTPAVLQDLNSLLNITRIKAGQKLVLPGPASKIINPRF